MKEEDAIELGKRAKELDIGLSVHGPYYVVLNSKRSEVVKNSIEEMKRTIHLSDLMGSKKIVFHPGFGKEYQKIIAALHILEKDKPKDVKILPETMGKHSQTGDLNEVLSICENTESDPCIDFGHLHARGLGSLNEEKDFREILVEIEKRLGREVLKKLHCHFYPIEFTEKGEKKHKGARDKDAFPKFEPFANLIREFKMEPTLISESKDSQDIGALHMRDVMKKILGI
jgi:deoxyribonuclease-4